MTSSEVGKLYLVMKKMNQSPLYFILCREETKKKLFKFQFLSLNKKKKKLKLKHKLQVIRNALEVFGVSLSQDV